MRLPQSNVSTATAALRKALRLLERASNDWRNGDPETTGPLHWSAAVPAAREALNGVLLALEDHEGVPAAAAKDAWRPDSRTPGAA